MTRSSTPARLGHRAIVLGASMAGLLAARVLSERFEEVLLLERDALSDGAAPRKGTPQALHAHGLLARGREIIESLCPGFTAALQADGCEVGDVQRDAPFFAGGQRFAEASSGHCGIAASRPAIEAELRRRVLAQPGVRAVTGVDVVAPVFDPNLCRVNGVRVVHREGGGEQTLAADLVVDCTGRASRSPAWLCDWGFERAVEERVEVGIGYATAYFRREPRRAGEPVVTIFPATPERPLPGVFIAQEPDHEGVPRWVVTLAGYAGDHPAPTLEALRERARRIGNADLVRITHDAEPLGVPLRYTFPASQRRRYERLARFPERYLVLGDALASFNPVYGQGMTVAACEALALRDALARAGLSPALARRFFAAARKAIDVPWQLAVGADLAIDSVAGPRPAALRWINRYMARVFRVAPHDPVVARAFIHVAHLVAPPQTLFAPGVLLRVLLGSWRRREQTPKSAVGVAAAG